MPGKCRPSLMAKTLENVMRSELSVTDKECIKNVFERYTSNEKTCDLDYKAEYERLACKLEEATRETIRMRERCRDVERENVKLKAIKATIEVVFGRSFDNATD